MVEVKARPLRARFAANRALWLPVLLGIGCAVLTAHLLGERVGVRTNAPPYSSLAADPLIGHAFRVAVWTGATLVGVAATWLAARLLSATPEQHRTGAALALWFGVCQFGPPMVRLVLELI